MDGGLSSSRPAPSDPAREARLEAALSSLAEALGATEEGSLAEGEAPGRPSLEERLASLESRARVLAAGERRARQAAASYRAASLALSRSPDSGALLEELLDYLNWIVAYDAAQVFLVDKPAEPRASREWRASPSGSLALEAESLGRRAGDRPLVEERPGGRLLYLPLRGPDCTLGAAVIEREGGRDFDEEELREAETFAGQAAAALRSASLYEDLRRADDELLRSYESCIEILSKTLDLRDHETEGHSLRVAAMSTTLAKALGIDDALVSQMRRGALLHDIGKIGIPDAILLKPGPLDEAEFDVMRRHPTIAAELFDDLPFLNDAIDVPWCHHERWDGGGYPRGLAGEDIPLTARVFAIADVWDALTHDRPYRKALGEEESLRIIAQGAGSQFDPRLVQFFIGSFDLLPQ